MSLYFLYKYELVYLQVIIENKLTKKTASSIGIL